MKLPLFAFRFTNPNLEDNLIKSKDKGIEYKKNCGCVYVSSLDNTLFGDIILCAYSRV